MMKLFKWLMLALLLAVVGAAVWEGRQDWRHLKRITRREKAPKFDLAQARMGNIAVTIQATGVVRPQNRLEIKPTVGGRIEELLVREGDTVKGGQVLAWISSTDRTALLDAARARGPETLAHWKDIYKPTPLIAPLDGTIIARLMEPGQTASLGDKILVMSDTLIVEAQVDETDLAHIRLGQPCTVTLEAYPSRALPAAVSHIAFEADSRDNVTIYKVQVLPAKMPEFVRSGMNASLAFDLGQTSQALLVPVEAVFAEGGLQQVRLPNSEEPEQPELREVKTGLNDGKHVEILQGLEEGDSVLVPKIQTPGANGESKKNPFMPSGVRPPRGLR